MMQDGCGAAIESGSFIQQDNLHVLPSSVRRNMQKRCGTVKLFGSIEVTFPSSHALQLMSAMLWIKQVIDHYR